MAWPRGAWGSPSSKRSCMPALRRFIESRLSMYGMCRPARQLVAARMSAHHVLSYAPRCLSATGGECRIGRFHEGVMDAARECHRDTMPASEIGASRASWGMAAGGEAEAEMG